jgi:hypothetical protein
MLANLVESAWRCMVQSDDMTGSYARLHRARRGDVADLAAVEALRPGGITPAQKKVPEAKARRSQDCFQWGLVSSEGVPGVRKGRVRRGHVGPPRPLEPRPLS